MRRPGKDHRKADSLECLRQVYDQGHSSLCLCFRSCTKSLHFPHCTLSSSVSTIGGVPMDAVLLLPLRHLRHSQSFPPTDQRWHQRNWPLTRDVFGNQQEHRGAGLLQPLATLLHLLKNSTFSPFFSFVKSKGTFGWKPSHPTPVFALYNLDAFSQVTFFQPRQRFLTFLQFIIPPWLILHILCFPRHIANASAILAFSPHDDLTISRLVLPPSESALLLSTSLAS